MSTHAALGIRLNDGRIKAIYCHFDGYPAGVGITLAGCYATQERVEALLELGSLSSLGAKLAPEPGQHHSFLSPIDNVTVAYHRDRGEQIQPGYLYPDLTAYIKGGQDDFAAEYLYLYEDGEWSYLDLFGRREWMRLAEFFGKVDADQGGD